MLVTDAVCLKVLDHENLLLAVGNSLHHYYQPDDGTGRTADLRVLVNLLPDHIHGLLSVPHRSSADEYCIVAFGGRSIVQLRLRRRDGRLFRQRPNGRSALARLGDWISSAHLFAAAGGDGDSDTETMLVLLTCQGTAVWLALGWSPLTDEADPVSARPRLVHTVSGPDQSTLYCSRIACSPDAGMLPWWQRQTFLGGTAFGELIVWRLAVTAGYGKEAVVQQLQRVSCHNGVIFSIDCDPQQRLLITTSDDRSVKVWRLDDNVDNVDAGWSMTLQRTLFAHTSRVFRGRLLPGGRLLSGGEDGQLCLWLAQSGALLARQSLGTGALWHIDYEPRSQTAVVATAGGNCQQFCVAAYQRSDADSLQQQQQQLQNGTASELSVVGSLRLAAGEHAVKLRFVAAPHPATDPHLVIVTNRNRLVAGHPDRQSQWVFAAHAVPFKVGVLETSGRFVAVAGGQRQCRVYEYNGSALLPVWHTEHAVANGGDSGAMVRTAQFSEDGGQFADVLIGDSAGNAELHVDWTGTKRRSLAVRMPPCREPWATALCRPSEQDVLIGDRGGHLHLYAMRRAPDGGGHSLTVVETLRHLHGRHAGITALRSQRPGIVLCAGHDGTVKCVRYTSAVGLHVLHAVALPMSWVQAVQCDRSGFVAVGFESNRCVVWSGRLQRTLAVIECGGGHRFADVRLGGGGLAGSGHFVYMRRKAVRWLRFDMLPATAFRLRESPNNWHSLSCTCVEVLPLAGPHRADLIVSGGDDNLLKFHVLLHAPDDGDPGRPTAAAKLTFLANIGTHVSSIKTLAIVRPPEAARNPNAWRIISAGGRAQICITDVAFPPEYEGERSHHLFQMHERTVVASSKAANRVSAIAAPAATDTRIMSVATFAGSTTTGFVAGCSTGLLRTFTFRDDDDSSGCRLTVDSTAEYGRCILKVLVIDDAVVATAATDGRVCLWLAQRQAHGGWQLPAQPFAHIVHHQSGIQSMDWTRPADDDRHVQLVTGGDDQSVVVSRFRLLAADDVNGQPAVGDVRTQSLAARHTAQVNGVRFGGGGGKRLYTTGVDQTVWLWQPDEQDAWRPQRQVGRTAVADVKGVQVCTGTADEVLVFGYGVQLLRTET